MTAALLAALITILPPNENKAVAIVAREYNLTEPQTALLCAIRRIENGRPGLEFGVGGAMDSGHPAHRFRDGVRSFECQARWAAGTIRRRFNGDIEAFARRWCPQNAARWAELARWFMRMQMQKEDGR